VGGEGTTLVNVYVHSCSWKSLHACLDSVLLSMRRAAARQTALYAQSDGPGSRSQR